MKFTLPPQLIEILRASLKGRGVPVEQIEGQEAFMLDPGLGPTCYLLADGRVFEDHRHWDHGPLRESTDDEAIASIVVGAKKTGVRPLLELVPKAPADSKDCTGCGGTRWMNLGSGGDGDPVSIICADCHGRGWQAA